MPILQDGDLVLQAEAGTGRSTAFVISSLQSININLKEVQILILAPTRIKAEQIHENYLALGQYMAIECIAVVGGARMTDAVTKINEGVHVIVGTPGRIFDMVQRGILKTDYIKMCCIDDAYEILNAGFDEQIKGILHLLSPEVQLVLQSANMIREISDITGRLGRQPVKIIVKEKRRYSMKGISQTCRIVNSESRKLEALLELCGHSAIGQAVIYCNGISTANQLVDALTQAGHKASALHSDMTPAQRACVLTEYSRRDNLRFLVLTDFMVEERISTYFGQLNMVINYDFPSDLETYSHRVGQSPRAARLGRPGAAVTLATPEDEPILRELERLYTIEIKAISSSE